MQVNISYFILKGAIEATYSHLVECVDVPLLVVIPQERDRSVTVGRSVTVRKT